MPHSRWNDIPGNELTDCGYRVLSRANDGSVDAFVKQGKRLAVFFQGHPEYEVNSLLLEYRRDVGRYLSRERDTYPSTPEGYCDQNIADVFTKLRDRALSDRRKELLEDFPTALVEKGITNTWHPVAARLYGNWMAYLYAQKERLA
jgi:homoserine O-succinyltransferase